MSNWRPITKTFVTRWVYTDIDLDHHVEVDPLQLAEVENMLKTPKNRKDFDLDIFNLTLLKYEGLSLNKITHII